MKDLETLKKFTMQWTWNGGNAGKAYAATHQYGTYKPLNVWSLGSRMLLKARRCNEYEDWVREAEASGPPPEAAIPPVRQEPDDAPAPSPLKLELFTRLLARHGSAEEALDRLHPGKYRGATRRSMAARLEGEASRHPDFERWLDEAGSIQAADEPSPPASSENPFEAERTEEAASKAFARHAISEPSREVSRFDTPPREPVSMRPREPDPAPRTSYLPPWAKWAAGGSGLGPDDFRVAREYVKPRKRRSLIASYTPRPIPPLPKDW